MLGSRASVTSRGLIEWGPQRPASVPRTVNAMRVTTGVVACGQRRPHKLKSCCGIYIWMYVIDAVETHSIGPTERVGEEETDMYKQM
ncbi:hypothetical protein ElyMa_005188200 [Elysia marginata]|uniref:Uncharacterized protein n=1 Tax=Elysia marginata TaxID=1093978 RepID=A0AAV4JS35_9GAST|nr:hypothetical protein ElyMa_005188200 [Elysia marginata]